jgi:hypothetical protein
MGGMETKNLSPEGGCGARAANAAAPRADDEEIVVVLVPVGGGDGRLPVDEHLPRHGGFSAKTQP